MITKKINEILHVYFKRENYSVGNFAIQPCYIRSSYTGIKGFHRAMVFNLQVGGA